MDLSTFTDSKLIDHGLLDNVSWLDANWMFLSIGGGVILFLWLLFAPRWSGSLGEKLHDPKWLGFLAIFVYAVHQFEEHAFDIFGRRYMFVPVFNASLITDPSMGVQLVPRATFLLNILFIWGVFSVWALLSKRENSFYLTTMSWGFAVFNGFLGHFVPIVAQPGELKYVPGAVQSVFMVAFGLYVLLVVFRPLGVVRGFVIPLVMGLLFHVTGLIIPVVFLHELPDEIVWPAVSALTCLLPILAMPLFERTLKLPPWQGKTTSRAKQGGG
jgi:hypothetical protein